MMLKKVFGLTAILALALIMEMGLASAHHSAYTNPRAPQVDPRVRVGGPYPSMSFYMSNLRGGIATHPRQDYRLRRSFSNTYYPRQNIYTNRYDRYDYDLNLPTRVGGYYGDRFSGLRTRTKDFIFTGGGTHFGTGSRSSVFP